MPRIGAYVPDDLWTEVVKTCAPAGTSEIVQKALRMLLANSPMDRSELDAAIDNLRRELDKI